MENYILYSLISIFIAWIWIDYFRHIDIFEKEKGRYLLLTFVLGWFSVYLVTGANHYLDFTGWDLNGSFVNDLLYCIFGIGLLEEIAKTIPFLIIMFSFRRLLNEPVDYLLYISVSALGFSAAENVQYFESYGAGIINNRAILSTVSHMFDTSLIAYGLILIRFRQSKYPALVFTAFLLLAAVSHGFYDFWLIFEGAEGFGWLITIFYFLITVSIFATVLNNALNNSSMFTYKKVVVPGKVSKRLLNNYAILFGLQIVLLTYTNSFIYAIGHFTGAVYFSGTIIIVSSLRLSRFKLIQNRWNPIRFELPFSFGGPSKITVKGDGENDALATLYYEEYFQLCPLTPRTSDMDGPIVAYIEKKVFLKDDESFFVAKAFQDEARSKYDLLLLKAKNYSTILVAKQFPIVAIMTHEDTAHYENSEFGFNDFEFREWGYMKPIDAD